jgi:hypothetical protein
MEELYPFILSFYYAIDKLAFVSALIGHRNGASRSGPLKKAIA